MNRSNASGEANFSTDFRAAFELGPVRSVRGGGEIAQPSLTGTDLVADSKSEADRPVEHVSGRPNPNLRRDLCSSVNDGAGYSGMVGLGEAYFGAFFLAIGSTDIQIGVLSTVPYLLGSLYQLLTPWGVRRFYSFRRWVVFNAALQATALLLTSLLTFALRADFWNVLLLLSLYWSGGLATSPVWNTWIEYLIPGRIRKQFLAARMRTSQVVMLLAMPAAGLAIQASSRSGYELVCFGTLLLAAAGSRYYSAYMLGRKSEHESWIVLAAPTKAEMTQHASTEQTREDALRVAWMAIPFFAAMHFSMFIAGPYYAPFMLRNMGLNYLHFMFLIVLSFVGRVLMLRWTGQLAKRHGTGWVLMLGSAGLVPLAGLWYFHDSFLFLCCLQLISGAAWGCYEYGVMMLLVEKVTGPKRLAILSWINSFNGLGMVAGMLVGGGLLRYFGEVDSTFVMIFILSSVFRLLSLSVFPYRLLRVK
jgi:MFS family permease